MDVAAGRQMCQFLTVKCPLDACIHRALLNSDVNIPAVGVRLVSTGVRRVSTRVCRVFTSVRNISTNDLTFLTSV